MKKPYMSNDRSHSPHETPHTEMLRLAELHPTYTLLEVFQLLRGNNWHIEELAEDQKEAYSKINVLTALQTMRSVIDDFNSKFILNSYPRRKQWLPTGKHAHVSGVIGSNVIGELVSSCDHFLNSVGSSPVKIFDNQNIIHTSVVQSIARTVLAALPETVPPTSQPVILKKRTILRRTFPASCFPSSIGNVNNQHWHQDSNIQFNDSLMLTLWIPLQDRSGLTRPGLQIIDSPVSYFSMEHGDSSPDIFPFLSQLFPKSKISSLQASAGDCIVFNGLTFHKTFTTPAMTEHRDALLIRIIDKEFAHIFPIQNEAEDLVSIV